MIRLTKRQILMLHRQLINETGGIHGIRDEDLLDSALSAPFQSFDGTDLYPSVIAKAVRMGFGLIENHAMLDGNKRLGVHSMLILLSLNGIDLKYTQKELFTVILNVASGHLGYTDLLQWVLDHQIK